MPTPDKSLKELEKENKNRLTNNLSSNTSWFDIILYEDKWAALEVKKSATASHRPNQEYYVDLMDRMSFAAFIYPENKEEILDELQQTLFSRR